MQKAALNYDHILAEIQKIKYTYRLNNIIRYGLKREEEYETQSVAEHVTNMLFLAYYFRDLEDPEHELDFELVTKIILYHDLGEIETGDIITVAKTQAHQDAEHAALTTVQSKVPDYIAKDLFRADGLYGNLESKEGMFAYAIDKLEGQIFWVEKRGVEMVKHIDTLQGLDINVVYPPMMNKIFSFLAKTPFRHIEAFMKVVHEEKMKTGIIDINKDSLHF